MRFRRIALPALLAVAGACGAAPVRADGAFAPPYLTGPLVDEGHWIDENWAARIANVLQNLHEQGALQFQVLLPESLQGLEIADYSIRVADAWKIGKKGEDKGLILIIAPNERKMRLEVGYGLEGDITDAFSRHVLDDVLRPHLREGHFGEGIMASIGAVTRKLGIGVDVPAVAPPNPARRHLQQTGQLGFWLLVLLILILRIFFWSRYGFFASGGFGRGGWGGGGFGGGFGGGGGWGGGGGGFGGGGASSSW